MKVHTKIIIDADGHIEQDDWYTYTGPLTLAKGGSTTVNVPGPSAEEKALQAEQTQLLRDQRDILSRQVREQNRLAPFLFGEAGLTPVLNTTDPTTGELIDPTLPAGEIISFDKTIDPLDSIRSDIEKKFLERTQAALAGELPINPALERNISTGETQLRESLLKRLGPGFETSTPGIDALDKFFRSSTDIREGARRGDLSLSEQLSLSREQNQSGRINDLLARSLGIANRDTTNINSALGITQGFGGIVNNLQGNRSLQLQGNIATAQANASKMGALFSGLGAIGGGAAAGFFSTLGPAAASSRDYKAAVHDTNISAIDIIKSLPVETWQYLGEDVTHLGTYAEDFTKATGLGNGRSIAYVDAIGIMMQAIQELMGKVEELENA